MSTTSDDTQQTADGQPTLRRVLGPGLLLLFIIGDILGAGIYAVTGDVAAEVGGAVWLPFVIAFGVALLTAFSYLELVTKYPQAAGAALYTHKAFGIQFVTFMVTFTVMCSGITSASTSSRALAANVGRVFDTEFDTSTITLVALAFILLVMLVNFRGVGESVRANVVLTCIELSGLLIIIFIGILAFGGGEADFSQLTEFTVPEDKSVFFAVTAATSLAFFAMVGFEDSVNMAEETKDPSRIFPRVLLTGLVITGCIYVLVSITAVSLVDLATLGESDTPLLEVVDVGAPDFPLTVFAIISVFAVSNTALINMLMASRLLYGMARERVLPWPLGVVHPRRRTPWVAIIFTTLLAVGLITFVERVPALAGTTSLLLLAVFTVVNIAVLVLRRDPVEHDHFRTPTIMAVLGAICSAFLVTPLSGRPAEQYQVAGTLLAIGLLLWAVNWALNKYVFHQRAEFDPATLDHPPGG